MQQILTYAFLVIYTVTILGIVLVIITDNRNPLKTLPWIIVLVFAPVVGLVFYFFFGQNLSKQRIISRRTRKRITMQLEEALDDGRPDIPDEHLPLARLLAATIHSVPLYGSRITPYTDGKSKMEALLAEIARAKHHIHIQYYIFCDDTTGCRLRDWSATTKRHIAGAEYYPAAERLTDDILQIVPSGPFGKWRALLQADSYAVSNARKRIWIQTPYYLPSDVLNSALQVAALAGIDVRLMLPARSDSKVVDLASHSYLDDMMKAGVKILFYKPGFLHSKLLIIDDSLTIIGSANMDFRSFEHNFEVNAFVYDREFTARMAGVFEDDASRCHALTPGEWFNRPRPRRWAESLMRVFSPLL